MRPTFLTRSASAAMLAVMVSLPFSSAAQAADVYMMTLPIEIRGTRAIEARAADRGIALSREAMNSTVGARRAAAFANLCIGHALQGRFAEAETFCDKSLENGDLAAMYVNRGAVRYLARDYAGSVADLERALELAPDTYQARANLEVARKRYALQTQLLAQDVAP